MALFNVIYSFIITLFVLVIISKIPKNHLFFKVLPSVWFTTQLKLDSVFLRFDISKYLLLFYVNVEYLVLPFSFLFWSFHQTLFEHSSEKLHS